VGGGGSTLESGDEGEQGRGEMNGGTDGDERIRLRGHVGLERAVDGGDMYGEFPCACVWIDGGGSVRAARLNDTRP
jgi:hypothetical protein